MDKIKLFHHGYIFDFDYGDDVGDVGDIGLGSCLGRRAGPGDGFGNSSCDLSITRADVGDGAGDGRGNWKDVMGMVREGTWERVW